MVAQDTFARIFYPFITYGPQFSLRSILSDIKAGHGHVFKFALPI